MPVRARIPRRSVPNRTRRARVIAAGIAAAALVMALEVPALAWRDRGHQLIARTASALLSPAAAARARELLDGRDLASAATWADDVRILRPWTGRWHFVGIPYGASIYDPSRDCLSSFFGDCIVRALERSNATLRDRALPAGVRAEALAWIVHLTADIHQPLHCIDDGDRGGNDVTVGLARAVSHRSLVARAWAAVTARLTLGGPLTLHRLWDEGFLPDGNDDGVVAELLAIAAAHREAGVQTIDPAGWALESRDVAVARVYRYPGFSPGGTAGIATIDEPYMTASAPVARQRMALAAVRLAKMVNLALGESPR